MIRFDKRKQDIILAIANSTDYLTGKAIALQLNISLRTVQNEISEINKTLHLIQSSNKGYSIIKNNYKTLTFTDDTNNLSYDHQILRALIMRSEPINIFDLAENFYISVPTLEKTLKKLNKILSDYDLKISRNRGMLDVCGKELNRRRFISYLIFEESCNTFNKLDNLNGFFPEINIEYIQSVVYETIISHEYYIENTYLSNLIINLTIAFYRMINNHYVDEEVEGQFINTNGAYSEDEYNIAECLCSKISSITNIKPEKPDIKHIASLFAGSIKPTSNVNENINDTLPKNFVNLLDNIIQGVFNYYMLDIDYSLCLYNFAFHIDAMIKRVKNKQPANNEILYSIKNSSPFIHDVSVNIAKKIEDKFLVNIPDSEIGFISIHIGYLIENATKQKNKVYILLLCQEYKKNENLIKNKLMEYFSDWIEIIIANTHDYQPSTSIGADLVITTSQIKIAGKKTVCISPFFNNNDYLNVNFAIHNCLNEKNKNYYNHLMSSLFHENLFFKRDDLNNKEDVIQFMGKKLIQFGVVEEGFIESVFKREELSSTCFLESFAIPHAIELNANKTMICVLLSNNGIKWDDHLIHIVLMIAIKQDERKRFVELYNGIVSALNDQEKIKLLVSANTHLEFINFLK